MILLRKADGGLYPENDDAIDALNRLKFGDVVTCEIKKPRDYTRHKRFFALLKYAFDHFEPEAMEYKGTPAMKSFERFRKDMTIVAGYYEPTFDISGNLRLEAKSISFDSMSQIDFDHLYSDMVDAVIKRILTNYTRDDLYSVIDKLAGFA